MTRIAPVFTLTPGPAGATPATLAALSQPILHHQRLWAADEAALGGGSRYPWHLIENFGARTNPERNRTRRHEAWEGSPKTGEL